MTDADLLTRLQSALAGRYTIERELGHGGMAHVFLAQDLKHHRPVAIKVLRPELAAVLGADRFLREIEIAAKLTHPHILPLYDSGEAEGFLYYVMPYVEGESLRDRLSREKQLPLEDALQLAREVADALSYAHSHDVVHRDIKPENILLQAGHAVVSDFGIARAITAAAGEKLTATGIAVGTPAYMSPEQAAGSKDLDGRSDIYSLSCVLYETLAGEPPFTGPTVESVVHQHLAAEPPSVTAIRTAVPEAVASGIRRALAKTPADRFTTAAQFAAALARPSAAGPSVPAAWWAPRRRLATTVGAVVLVVGLGAVLVLGRHRPLVIPSASVIAVVPFAPTAPDSTLARLGRDLVVTLSANLDGVGDIRTVDALTVLAQESRPALSLQEGVTLARRLGASSVLHGSLVRVGPNVRIDLGLFTTDSAAPVARASVTAAPEDLTALTDSATWALLREVWRTREPPTPTLAAVTTQSVPALRAFLEGERAIVESRWEPAARAYRRAIEADSTFWFAYWRYAYATDWVFGSVESWVRDAYRRNRASLPVRERLLIEAYEADSLTKTLARAKEITERFADYWPGWMHYADRLVHEAPFLGYTRTDARAALERTVGLNPRLIPAWEHLAWLYSLERDTAALARDIAELTRLGAGRAFVEGYGFDWLGWLRLYYRLHQSGGGGDRVLADSVARYVNGPLPMDYQEITAFLLLWQGFPAAQIAVSRRVVAHATSADLAAFHSEGIATAWAARGAWDSALVAADQALRRASSPTAAVDVYRLAVIGVWLGALEPEAATERRAALASASEQLEPADRAELAWLDGMLAVARRDRGGLTAARQAVQRTDDTSGVMLDRSLAAFELEMMGSRRRAAQELAALEWHRAEYWKWGNRHGWLTPISRLAAARWLVAEGDTAQAARLLNWHQAVPSEPAAVGPHVMLEGLAYLEQARIEDARGRSDLARRYFEEFLRRYDMPVPAHRHLVEEAQAALARLEERRTGEGDRVR